MRSPFTIFASEIIVQTMEDKEYPSYEEENLMANEPVIRTRRHQSVWHGLPPTQSYLLRVFAHDDSEETAKEIQEVVFKHLQKRMGEEADHLWDEGFLDQKRSDELRHMDFHAK